MVILSYLLFCRGSRPRNLDSRHLSSATGVAVCVTMKPVPRRLQSRSKLIPPPGTAFRSVDHYGETSSDDGRRRFESHFLPPPRIGVSKFQPSCVFRFDDTVQLLRVCPQKWTPQNITGRARVSKGKRLLLNRLATASCISRRVETLKISGLDKCLGEGRTPLDG